MIIDIHGHYTTAPKALEDWRNRQIAGIKDPSVMPKVSELKISDDELRASIIDNQLKKMQERGSDLTVFSPRASFMAHHIGDFNVSSTWAAICNELCYRVSRLFPDHFIPAAMLPQSPGVDPKTCIPELEKCVKEYGFVAINLNPDPSGGHWTSPPLTDSVAISQVYDAYGRQYADAGSLESFKARLLQVHIDGRLTLLTLDRPEALERDLRTRSTIEGAQRRYHLIQRRGQR